MLTSQYSAFNHFHDLLLVFAPSLLTCFFLFTTGFFLLPPNYDAQFMIHFYSTAPPVVVHLNADLTCSFESMQIVELQWKVSLQLEITLKWLYCSSSLSCTLYVHIYVTKGPVHMVKV